MEASATPAADPAGYALAYDEAKRALDEQERVVAELRSRAGTLIAAAAITTSFLGGRILSSHHLHPLAWAAIGCFAFVGITLLVLLWPWRDWRFTVNAQSFIQTYLEPSDGAPLRLPAIHRDLALHMEAAWRANRGQLRWLQAAFRLAATVLVVEVILWIIALANQS
jgi:hypothetical protein